MSSKLISRIFTFIVIAYPILGVYKSPLEYFDLGTFITLLLIPIIIKKSDFKIAINKPLLILLYYIFFSTLILILLNSLNTLSILRTGKFIVLIFVVLLCGYNRLFDKLYALEVLKIVTNIAIVYLIIQVILNKGFGIILPNGIPALADNDAYLYTSHIAAVRPSSFFLEPAHFAQYVLVYLTYCLFGVEQNNTLSNRWRNAIFILVGIIFSTSGQGLILACLLICIWLFTQMFMSKISLLKIVALLFVVLVSIFIIPLLLNLESVNYTLSRIFTDNLSGGGNALESRLRGYEYIKYLKGINLLIGMGFGNIPEGIYMSGFAYIIYCTGIFGFLIFICTLLSIFKKAKGFQRPLLIAYFALLIGAQMFTASNICFYFAILYININDIINERNVKIERYGLKKISLKESYEK